MLREAASQATPLFWLVLGNAAQGAFFLRFLVQWIASERKGQTVVPIAFWYLSLVGGLGLLAYAIHRQDQVFILGQSVGLLVYSRNLVLVRRERRRIARPPVIPTAVDVPLAGGRA